MPDLIWLATQGTAMLERYDNAPEDPSRRLRERALQKFPRNGGIDTTAIAAAIDRRFDHSVLRRLGLAFTSPESRRRGWHRRALSGATDRAMDPSVFLVLLGTLYRDLEEFLAVPGGAAAQKHSSENLRPEWAAQVSMALAANKQSPMLAGQALGVSFHAIRQEMIRQGITVSRSKLPPHLTEDRYQDLLALISAGGEKKRLMSEFQVSEYFLEKVALWEPGLHDRWDAARRRITINENRRRLENFVVDHPGVSRSQLFQALPGPYECISKTEPEWIDARMARSKRDSAPRGRTPRTDWGHADRTAAKAVAVWAASELESERKPVRLSPNRFLIAHGLQGRYHRNRTKFSLTEAALTSLCEKPSDYRRRRLAWAARSLANEGIALTREHLRLAAAMPLHLIVKGWEGAVQAYGQK